MKNGFYGRDEKAEGKGKGQAHLKKDRFRMGKGYFYRREHKLITTLNLQVMVIMNPYQKYNLLFLDGQSGW
jgi:hypothetical protein